VRLRIINIWLKTIKNNAASASQKSLNKLYISANPSSQTYGKGICEPMTIISPFEELFTHF
jgi:hypothetical protein